MGDEIRSGVRRLFRLAARTPGQTRGDVEDEMALHLELRVQQLVAHIEPTVAIAYVRSLAEVRDLALARQRFLMTLVLVFAGVGLTLAVVGVYGILAQVAVRRTREIGIRMAMGARSSGVQWLVVRHGLGLVVAGIVVGTAAALAATRVLQALLFRVSASDPLTFVAVAALLAVAALVASWIPARRAARVDPAVTLRAE